MQGRIAILVVAFAQPIPASADTATVHVGLASYYARSLQGNVTASGAALDNRKMIAAHPTLPFGTIVRVTNLANGKSVTLEIVDRGPVKRARTKGVIIDVSRAAAAKLGFIDRGRTRVRVEVVGRDS